MAFAGGVGAARLDGRPLETGRALNRHGWKAASLDQARFEVPGSVPGFTDSWTSVGKDTLALSLADGAAARASFLESDHATAVWDSSARCLTLQRPPLGRLSFHYKSTPDHAWFSSEPADLANGTFDSQGLAESLRANPKWPDGRTGLGDVSLLGPGRSVAISRNDVATSSYQPLKSAGSDTAEALAQAMRLRLRDRCAAAMTGADAIGTHLSGGRDSGAVTAMTAQLLAQNARSLDAFTYAGRIDPHVDDRYIYDESATAAALSGRYPNIRHHHVRPAQFPFCTILDRYHRHVSRPFAGLANLPWWDSISASAASQDIRLLLTGQAGNLTISAGGPWALNDLFASNPLSWWRAVRRCLSHDDASLPSLLNMSFGGRLPAGFQRGGSKPADPIVDFCRGDLRDRWRQNEVREDIRPPRSYHGALLAALESYDAEGGRIQERLYGVVHRDPTADPVLAGLALAMTPVQLASPYDRRAIYETAFATDLPPSILRPPRRGSQGADWNIVIDVDDIRQGLSRYRDAVIVGEWVDVDRLEAALDRWPTGRVVETAIETYFVEVVLKLVSIASFLYVHSRR